MADNNTIARPYATAIFELAKDADSLGPWSESLAVAGQLLADRDLVEYLGNPQFDDEQRLEFLTGLFKIETQIDENLIGGAVIRAGDVVIDGSLRARLEGLATALIK